MGQVRLIPQRKRERQVLCDGRRDDRSVKRVKGWFKAEKEMMKTGNVGLGFGNKADARLNYSCVERCCRRRRFQASSEAETKRRYRGKERGRRVYVTGKRRRSQIKHEHHFHKKGR